MTEDEEPPQKQEPPEPTNGNVPLPSDLVHQIRQVAAGLVGIGIACYDRWHYAEPEKGFSTNIDELVLLVSLGVLAGAAGLFRMPGSKP